ncbi:hypothetical protein SAMN03159496_00202 [Rhizobium sp. NFR07]|uniref:hypothetical protein n=1 Tax=Rhizobium sp. NFR07 TaxID=1566262 RepID=UPI0008EE7697|nr:hypothetical protein [Rhizobium sp. NFR07]SFA76085.1 hypothetical protein SAMN03159496_00202 [Rhizobium sp. NFR07]
MSLIKSVGWMLAGMLGYLLMIVSGIVILSALFLTSADLTLQNIAILAVCVLLFLFGFYLNYKNIRR